MTRNTISSPEALLSRAVSALKKGKLDHAAKDIEAVLNASPLNVEALQIAGIVACEKRNYDQAVNRLERAAKLRPTSGGIWFNLGKALHLYGRNGDALSALDKALNFQGGNRALTHLERGNVLVSLARYPEARIEFESAIELHPQLAAAHINLGSLLYNHLKDVAAALEVLKHAVHLDPQSLDALSLLIDCQSAMSEWTSYSAYNKRMTEAVAKGEPGINPLTLTLHVDDPRLHQKAAALKIRSLEKSIRRMPQVPFSASIHEKRKIRLAYMSNDLHEHATSYLTAGVFEHHRRDRFELFAISLGRKSENDIRKRIVAAFDTFTDCHGQSAEQVAYCIRNNGIDILVDLNAHTSTNIATQIGTIKPAPVQVNYLGYPGTAGSSAWNYIILDPFIATPEVLNEISEKAVILPHCYQCNDDKRVISTETITREACGLPEGMFIFCCFNYNRKITPQVFDVWMDILKACEKSLLWLLVKHAKAKDNLRLEAKNRGVAPERLIFAERMPLERHLARYRLADLFLDTFPYTAHTTASDALWAGCPVLTYAGRSFPSRVSGSLLHAVGLSELITYSLEDYQAAAIELGKDPERVHGLREKLNANIGQSPLFDTALITRNLETAYEEMWLRYSKNKAPACIDLRQVLAS